MGFLMGYAPKQIETRNNLGWCYRCLLDEEYYYGCLARKEGHVYSGYLDESLGTAGDLA